MATATVAQQLALEQLYIAYFGRAADPTGFAYWTAGLAAGTDNLQSIANEFSNSAESKALYPLLGAGSTAVTTQAATDFVTAVYFNLYHRAPDAVGLTYFVSRLTPTNAGDIIKGISDGAQGSDLTSIQQRDLDGLNYTTSHTVDTYTAGGSIAAVAGTFILTTGTDVATANIFSANLAYTPGGNSRVNTLQDEDQLTGVGTNPTLNATLGSIDGQNNGAQSTVITPKVLNGVETINAFFSGSVSNQGAVTSLDLQNDSVTAPIKTFNITGITDNQSSIVIKNFTVVPTNLGVANTSSPAGAVSFRTLDAAAAGAADAVTLTVSNVNIGQLNLNAAGVAAGTGNGIEFVTLVTNGAAANALGSFNDTDITKLSITGAQDLGIGSINYNNQGKFTEIDGSTATGKLNLTLDSLQDAAVATNFATTGGDVAFKLTTGSGADTINSTINFGNPEHTRALGNINDIVDAGIAPTGAVDTLALSNTGTQSFTDHATYKNFEAVTVTRTDGGLGDAELTVDSKNITGDQTFFVVNKTDKADTPTTYTLNNLTVAEATQITIAHSGLNAQSFGNDGLLSNTINANVESGVSTVGVTIVNGTNSDPRFNFQLNAPGVANITITDSDTESNTVRLLDTPSHTGTITLTGGVAGQFLNLDSYAGVNGYDIDVSGLAVVPTVTDKYSSSFSDFATLGVKASVFTSADVADRDLIKAVKIDATAEKSDVIVRVGAANQNIQLGTGNDTVIFADRSVVTPNTSGLTIDDTVAGGAGVDTIVFDGAGHTQLLRASEWTHLSGIDVLRLAGAYSEGHVSVAGISPTYGVGSSGGSVSLPSIHNTVTTDTPFELVITTDLVKQTDNGNRLIIVNNDGLLGGGESLLKASPINTNTENSAIIDLNGPNGNTLDGSHFVTFVGPNDTGTRQSPVSQVVKLNDVTANGGNHLDGGDPNVNAFTGNNNFLKIYRDATVTVGDLANTKNFQTIQFLNDTTVAQTLALTLDDATVDALVDTSHKASSTAPETLFIQSIDSTPAGAYALLDLRAGQLTAQSNLVVYGSQGADVIETGGGADTIIAYDTQSVNPNIGGDVINAGGGIDYVFLGDGKNGHTNVDTVTVNTSGETIYLYGLQSLDNVNISVTSTVWSEPSNIHGHGVVNWNISDGNVSLVNPYLDVINLRGGTTVVSHEAGANNNGNTVNFYEGTSSIDLGTTGHINDVVNVRDTLSIATVLDSDSTDTSNIHAGISTFASGANLLNAGHQFNIYGESTVNLGIHTGVDLIHVIGTGATFAQINNSTGDTYTLDGGTSTVLGAAGGANTINVTSGVDGGSSSIDLGVHSAAPDTLNLTEPGTGTSTTPAYYTYTVTHAVTGAASDHFFFADLTAPAAAVGIFAAPISETAVLGTDGLYIDAATGILHFTNGGNANTVPTHSGATLAGEIMNVLQGNPAASAAQAHLVVYNETVGGVANTWIFDAASNDISGIVVELVGVSAHAGISAALAAGTVHVN